MIEKKLYFSLYIKNYNLYKMKIATSVKEK